MSTQSPFGGRTAQAFPTLPRGDVLGTYDSYPEAQRVVAKLAEADFPVAKLSIVGNDLKTVERVTGKMTYGRAALAGALSGLWLGFFFGIVLTLFSPQAGGLFAAAAVIGAGFGMLYGIVSFAITKRQRDFTSIHQVLATTYQIVVDPQLSGQAQRLLGQGGAIEHTSWDQGGASPSGKGAGQGFGQGFGPGQGGGPGRNDQGQLGQSGQQQWRPGTGGAPGYGQPGGAPQDGGPRYGQNGGAPRYGQDGGPRYGQDGGPQYGQAPQQGRPAGAPPQGAPYGGHATPHQPGGAEQQPARDRQQGGDAGQRPASAGGQEQGGQPRYGTNDGPRYGTNDGPRYGTNDGRRYDGSMAAGDRAGAAPGAGTDDAPRYGTNDGGARVASDSTAAASRGTTAPRYGTNDGAARSTTDADTDAPAQRPTGTARTYGTNDGPRYGEQAPVADRTGTDDADRPANGDQGADGDRRD
ncbi:general stress protein [Curtobacterium aetherium]|uniref:Uncharacterized protein n=1 Tax=Curtobacterium aetherium TaxID=2841594 RepID=A0ACD1E0K6_9MICO|nr:general stress protein [Curtobacterium sp. L6-1]QWS32415.1 hypothetical protein KM842_08855 [Curtobacterium sp. L6-1]